MSSPVGASTLKMPTSLRRTASTSCTSFDSPILSMQLPPDLRPWEDARKVRLAPRPLQFLYLARDVWLALYLRDGRDGRNGRSFRHGFHNSLMDFFLAEHNNAPWAVVRLLPFDRLRQLHRHPTP